VLCLVNYSITYRVRSGDEKVYVWDYENGIIINTETGEVVDQIYDYNAVQGERKPYIGTTSFGLVSKANKSASISRKLKMKGLRDERGTYVSYKLGLTNKSVKSLKREYDCEIPEDMKALVSKILKYIEMDPVLSSRTDRVKLGLAIILAQRLKGKGELPKCVKVNKHMRKLVAIASKRLLAVADDL